MRSRVVESSLKLGAVVLAFAVASAFALQFGGGGLWRGLTPIAAASNAGEAAAPYDLTQLKVVNEVLRIIREKYVDPKRVKPREMLLSALNFVQREVAQIIVLHEEGAATVKVRVDTQEKEFRVDNVQGPWDVSARLREVFAFMQDNLRGTEVDLRDIEYAACNGMLHTLDPHSTLYSPEAYKDMNLSMSGQFGGLGIVISLRDQQLTVINPMPGTPASRAGLKRYDRIVKIDNEATLNMGLNEAVNHLRGMPGSKVTIWVHRDGDGGWPGQRPFDLVRETIHVQSVDHKLLDGNVGYIRIRQFIATTSTEMDKAIDEMKATGPLKGVVLDLRGNPGGLLEQAVKVVDKFIVSGPIVATVGNSEGRDEKSAHAQDTEPNYPIALLVNGSSASASEIVAGAMKNHDRAVIVGETTFGKGSVQLVFNDLPDKAALKLTIAQYLTEPGDISIQGTGVTPDIELDPMTVDNLEMDISVDGGMLKERDLSRSLSNARAHEGVRSRRRCSATTSRRRSARRSASAAASRTTSSTWTSRSSSAAISLRTRRKGRARPGARGEVAHRDHPRLRARQGRGRAPEDGHRLDRRPRERQRLGAAARREGGDRPPEQRGHGRRSDHAQGHRDEQGHGPALSALRDDPQRQRHVREQGADHRQARPGQDPRTAIRAARLEDARHPRPQDWLDGGAPEGRPARVPHPEGRPHPRRRHQAPLRGGAHVADVPRRGGPRVDQGARAPDVLVLVPDRRQPQGQRRRPGAARRGHHDVHDGAQHRQRQVVGRAGEPQEPLGARRALA